MIVVKYDSHTKLPLKYLVPLLIFLFRGKIKSILHVLPTLLWVHFYLIRTAHQGLIKKFLVCIVALLHELN